MNKSAITLVSFKKFLSNYFQFRNDAVSFKDSPELTPSYLDSRVSFLEQSLTSENRNEWLSIRAYPELAQKLNAHYLDENPWLELINLN